MATVCRSHEVRAIRVPDGAPQHQALLGAREPRQSLLADVCFNVETQVHHSCLQALLSVIGVVASALKEQPATVVVRAAASTRRRQTCHFRARRRAAASAVAQPPPQQFLMAGEPRPPAPKSASYFSTSTAATCFGIPVSVNKTLLLCYPWPCNPAAKTAIQRLT